MKREKAIWVNWSIVLAVLLISMGSPERSIAQPPSDIYQYSAPVGGRTAFLWIPPKCQRVRGIIIAMENALELNWMEDPIIRETAAQEGLAMVWLSDGKPTDITWEMKPPALAAIDRMFDDLAGVSGYPEIENAPLIVTGHSWNGRLAWAYPNARPDRTIAAIPIRTYPMPDTLSFSGIPLCYIVGQTTELPEFNDGRPGDRDFFWPVVRRTALALRAGNEDDLIGVVIHPGGLHMDWSEDQSRFLALFIRKACHYRLPTSSSADGKTVLRKVNRTSGWLTDTGGMEPDNHPPAPYSRYKGDPKKAYWFFDEEMARAAVAFNGDRKTKRMQMPTFVREGVDLPVSKDGYVHYKFIPENGSVDGLTFKMAAGFLREMPEGLIGAGAPLGHADSNFIFRVTMGPAIQTGADEFRIRFTRQKPRNVTIVATQAGNEIYRRAKQPVVVEVPAKLAEGQQQQIDFPQPADQKVGVRALALGAHSSSGLPVSYYVVSGPAWVDGDSLRFTELPVRDRLPVRITVVAWQWGRTMPPLWQSAEPVKRELYLTGDNKAGYDLSPVTRKIQGWVDSGDYSGAALLVVKDKKTIYEKYFGTYSSSSVAYIASAGKWLAAATIAAVVDDGKLSWDDRVSKWLPGFTDKKGTATLRQLLSHTSGFPDYQPVGQHPDNYQILEESVLHIQPLLPDTMPGAVFHYGGLAMQVAGRMAELATGKNWEDLFEEKIAGPLKMSSTHFTPVDATPGHNPMLGGGARTNLNDYGHFLAMVADGGVYEGRRILSAASIREMEADQVKGARVPSGQFVEKARGGRRSDIYGLGEWREEVDASGEATLLSSPSWAGAYPWIDKENNLYGFFLARVNDVANAKGFSGFYSSPVLPMMIRDAIKTK